MNKYELNSINQLSEYLDKLSQTKEVLVLFSIKDTAGYWLSEKIQYQLNKLGLQQNLVKEFMVGYIAIIKGNEVVFEKKSQKGEKLQYAHSFDNLLVYLESFPYNAGNKAAILINGKDYAMNKRGINIVVYDIRNNEIIDSVAFDTHVKEFTCRRKMKLSQEHYDIGVVGCWWGANYGSILNGYAVYKTLKKMGLSVLMVHKHNAMPNDWEIVNTHNENFIKKFYGENEVSPVIPFDDLGLLNEYCDMFLVGSDQIWNYGINKIFDMVFMLNFVDDSKKKLSFGTSFGHGKDNTPENILPHTQELLQRFHAVSVREKSGADICREIYGIKAKVVVEPVFCLDVNEYGQLAEQSGLSVPSKPYILTYILDPTKEKREAILNYSKLTGMEVINILDGDPRVYEKNKKMLDLPGTQGKIGAEDFLKLYKNASFVISDSFHGTAFAIIFNKRFLSITNFRRGAMRFEELLSKFGLTERLVKDPIQIPVDKKYLEEIDFKKINNVILEQKIDSLSWLENVINTPMEKLPSIKIPENTVASQLDLKYCTGCSSCVNICPTSALSLEPDNLGYYRAVLNTEKCINCGKCLKVCPAYRLPEKRNAESPKCYEFITADKELLEKSSSGGVFGLLARLVLKRGGCVCGAAWKDDFSVRHIMIDSEEELYRLQKSKYLQSYMGDVPKQIQKILDSGREVLFSGCPCQVAGLLSFLGKEYSNLVTIDLLCGNAPSTMFFQKYIQEEFPNGIKKYEFRHKVQGWNSDCVTVTVTDGRTEVRRGGAQDNYQRVYHNHVMCAHHCEECQFQSVPRYGDITIGDFWWLDSKDVSVNVKDGVSAVLINNLKGEQLFREIPDEVIEVKKETPIEWLSGNGLVRGNKNFVSPARDSFYSAIQTMGFKEASNYALKPNHGLGLMDNRYAVLNHSSKLYHFRFDSNVWQETELFGYQTLMVKQGESKVGRYACLPLYETLGKGKKYRLYFRFKINSESSHLNLHIKDSGTKYYQMIHSHKISHSDIWEVVDIEFTPQSDIFDEFMIGASQVKGLGNYLCIGCVKITEV